MRDAARRLAGLPAWLVGVRCPLDEVMRRRDAGDGAYLKSGPAGDVPEPVLRWQDTVHRPGLYDLEVDTSALSPEACADAIARMIADGSPTAFPRLA